MGKEFLRALPSVDEVVNMQELSGAIEETSRALVTSAVRGALAKIRSEISSGKCSETSPRIIASEALKLVASQSASNIKRVINASGTVLHTNLGRAFLCDDAIKAVELCATGAVNLEYDLAQGERGERDSHVEGLITALTGAEAGCVVNNNAAAVLIALNTLAEGQEVLISRGELIEIGGSFRLPEIIRKSGCILKEVGTTNRTHPADYTTAITEKTAAILKAHTSNYRVVGFTSEVQLSTLVTTARARNIPLIEDLGSGALVDLTAFGLGSNLREPLVRESIEAGADVVTFSGDKLLGGPQAGIIAGSRKYIDLIRKNPLKRALRVDKLTLSALEATLRLYLTFGNSEKLAQKLPTLKYLTRSLADIERTANEAVVLLRKTFGAGYDINVADGFSEAGSGSLPEETIPTRVVTIKSADKKPGEIFRYFLDSTTPILGRIKDDLFMLDMRMVYDSQTVVPKY